MSPWLVLLGWVLAAALVRSATGVGRWLGARALGIRGLPPGFGVRSRWSFATSSLGPWLWCVATGVAVPYIVAGFLLGAGLGMAGTERIDEQSMRVVAEPGGPAFSAGLRSGDHLDTVNGKSVTSWTELRSAIARADGPVDLGVTRDGEAIHVQVTPDASHLIRVRPPTKHEPASAQAVAYVTACGPVLTLWATVHELVEAVREATRPHREDVSGPVGIIRRAGGMQFSFALAIYALGGQCSFLWPIGALAGVILAPGRRPRSRHASPGTTDPYRAPRHG